MTFTPHVAVTSYDSDVKKIIHAIWVRQRADIFDPGIILGNRDLRRELAQELRTTGGDLLQIDGPTITHPTAEFDSVVKCPIFIQMTDGSFFKAENVGNNPTSLVRLRSTFTNARHRMKQQLFGLRNYIRRRFNP